MFSSVNAARPNYKAEAAQRSANPRAGAAQGDPRAPGEQGKTVSGQAVSVLPVLAESADRGQKRRSSAGARADSNLQKLAAAGPDTRPAVLHQEAQHTNQIAQAECRDAGDVELGKGPDHLRP